MASTKYIMDVKNLGGNLVHNFNRGLNLESEPKPFVQIIDGYPSPLSGSALSKEMHIRLKDCLAIFRQSIPTWAYLPDIQNFNRVRKSNLGGRSLRIRTIAIKRVVPLAILEIRKTDANTRI